MWEIEGMQWSPPEALIRDDDPYHAWSFLQREDHAHRRLLCPVLLEAKTGSDDKGAQLKASYEHIAGLIFDDQNPDRPFLISSWDRDALNARLALEAGGLGVHFHRRLVLVYADERVLFPRTDSVIQDETEHYNVLFIGRAIADNVGGKSEDAGEGGGAGRNATPILAIIDESFAFLNDAFVEMSERNGEPELVSRFQRLLFLDRERRINGDSNVYAGGELTKKKLDDLIAMKASLSEAKIYQMPVKDRNSSGIFFPLDLTSEAHQPLAYPISHGTHVTDTALRAYQAAEPTSEELTLYGVTVPTDITQDTSGQSLGTYLLAAMHQIMLWAEADVKGSQLVINFSFGFVCGPKDGSSKLNRVIARLLESRNKAELPTALVVPMGNSAKSRAVVRENLAPGKCLEVDWAIQPDDRSPNFIEIFSRGAPLRVELIAPSDDVENLSMNLGEDPGQCQKSSLLKSGEDARPIAVCSEWKPEEGSSWDSRGFIALGATRDANGSDTTVPSGYWRLRITNLGETCTLVEAMIQRDDAPGTYPANGRQSYFDSYYTDTRAEPCAEYGITHYNTRSVFSAIDSPYVYAVGAGMGEMGDRESLPVEASPYGSLGPENEKGPAATILADRSEYFHGIFRAGTYSGTEYAMSGSSVSAPQLAGYLAAHPNKIGLPVEDWIETTTWKSKNAAFGIPFPIGSER